MMRNILLSMIFIVVSANAKTNIVVSVLPQKTFVEKIAKELVDVTLMVEPGESPHSYEPKPSQMKSVSNADIYFSIGVEFEKFWLEKFRSQNRDMKIVDISKGVSKLEMKEHGHGHEGHDHSGLDPHIWTSPKNVKIIAQNIYDALVEADSENREFYKTNLDQFLTEINSTDTQIREILKDLPKMSKFMVFHPSWGYFANEYNLIQIAVEVEGKRPKPRELITIIKEAKEEDVKVIFTQPEFSDSSAKLIAKEAGVKVKKISPLNPEWSKNLIEMASSIAKK